MRIILDTNVLISALIKDSFSRAIILLSGEEFYYPEQSMREINKYKSLILEKSGLSEEDFRLVLEKLLEKIVLIKEEEIKPFLKEAREIMEEIDPKDVIFIASALAYPDSLIWSDDAHFGRQNKARVWKTKDIIEDINKT